MLKNNVLLNVEMKIICVNVFLLVYNIAVFKRKLNECFDIQSILNKYFISGYKIIVTNSYLLFTIHTI